MKINKLKHNLSNFFSLFTSFATLICCALPTLLVTLGLGAVAASSISAFPFLITLSKNKHWLFLIAFLFLVINFYLIYEKNRRLKTCKVPQQKSESVCEIASRWNKIILWVSVSIFIISFIFAYLTIPILKFFH